jgi:hypothetical protein
MRTRFSGATSGVGAVMMAEGKNSGDGTVTITRAEPATGIGYDLDFEHGTQLFHGGITFNSANDATKITWVIETDMGTNPFKRWAGLVLDKLMGGDMAAGLANLKQQVESVQ